MCEKISCQCDAISRREQALKSICKGWYTDPSLPGSWSTNWLEWHLIHFWRDRTRDGQLKIDKLFKEIWQLPGTVEPLAYIAGGDGLYFLFTAGGRYYFYADEVLTVHSMEFASAREFVDYALKAAESKGGGHLPDVTIPLDAEADFSWWTQMLSDA